ncbi:2386_t:CDS:2 [Paraglomus brasilianum]|uniref:2386_t:CDS:1 n=1 Tax=Paraglomus brasilianum TaxID=144538 RepID=A0A9N9G7T5_9GLOM|nr:2386_t:CDS:2 [Paraglomus brasilianum]
MYPLKGIKVIEIVGLAAGPFAGMVLADFGADVIRVDKLSPAISMDVLTRHKRSISIDFKHPQGYQLVKRLICTADVLIDTFRPGVMEKLKLGPERMCKENDKLIYARISGFGQSGERGKYSKTAGHDINYIAVSGILSMLGRQNEKPTFPLNLLADFAGGSMMCVLGVLLALLHRNKTGKGQVVDAGMTQGISYISTFPYLLKQANLNFVNPRGKNVLDGGAHFYEVYETKDGKYMAVGALEPQFYETLVVLLNLSPETLPEQYDESSWPQMKALFTSVFLSKTRAEWCEIFDGKDACVTPVIEIEEGVTIPPVPAPILSVTPALCAKRDGPNNDGGCADGIRKHNETTAEELVLPLGRDSKSILKELGYTDEEIDEFVNNGVVGIATEENEDNLKSKL